MWPIYHNARNESFGAAIIHNDIWEHAKPRHLRWARRQSDRQTLHNLWVFVLSNWNLGEDNKNKS